MSQKVLTRHKHCFYPQYQSNLPLLDKSSGKLEEAKLRSMELCNLVSVCLSNDGDYSAVVTILVLLSLSIMQV